MPRATGDRNIPLSVRRAIALDALRVWEPARIAREHGVSRPLVNAIRDEAMRDPEGAVEEARSELEFRHEVLEILGG